MGVVPPKPGFLEACATVHPVRRPADLRRSDHRLPCGVRRRAGALRRPAGPDHAGQDHRRRPARGRLRRPPRHHGPWRPLGPVYQAGTLSGNPLAMAAGLATLRVLAEPATAYERLEALGAAAEQGLRAAADAAGRAVTVNRVGPMLTLFFCEGPVRSFADAGGGRHRRLCLLLAAHARGRHLHRAVAVRGRRSVLHSRSPTMILSQSRRGSPRLVHRNGA